ncbi:helix-turn-helix domain-containing protein [Rhodococcus sp. IC4_135]|uniref:helix-turn-helix domain-containing protein n=1 Tax=Rhodococcus sp. IC4_135 TaxID=2715537 RepID=UPI0014230D84|nr:helix-turn-helix domain-containing protein [Rhodococcus sp. IC4_135]
MNNIGVLTDLCSVVDAAEILGKPVSTVQKWARTGRIPVVGKLSGLRGAYILDRTEMNHLAAQRKKARK